MPRCSLCDYAEGLGSDFLGIPPDPSIKVRFNHVHGDYICSVCEDHIGATMAEWDIEEEEIEEMEDDE